MSRAFVKEPDGDDSVGELPDLPISRHANYMTPAGLRQLRDRLAGLQDARRKLSGEKTDAMAAKPQLDRIAREARYLEARLESAIPIDPAGQPPGRVAFGLLVSVAGENDARRSYQIVGEDEADPNAGKISWVSPLARALQDAEVGDLVTWRRPSGDMELEVLAIERPEG